VGLQLTGAEEHDLGSALGRPAVDVEVVVPACNAESEIAARVQEFRRELEGLPCTAAVVVVDCGSVDATADTVASLPRGPVPVHLLNCSDPRGLGWLARAARSSQAEAVAPAAPEAGLTRLPVLLNLIRLQVPLVVVTRATAVVRRLLPSPRALRFSESPFRLRAGPVVEMACMPVVSALRVAESPVTGSGIEQIAEAAVAAGLPLHELRSYRPAAAAPPRGPQLSRPGRTERRQSALR
jgi:hypothetical protein